MLKFPYSGLKTYCSRVIKEMKQANNCYFMWSGSNVMSILVNPLIIVLSIGGNVIGGGTHADLTQGHIIEIAPWWSPVTIHIFTQLSVAMVSTARRV